MIFPPSAVVAILLLVIVVTLAVVCCHTRRRRQYSVPSSTNSELGQLDFWSPPSSPSSLSPDVHLKSDIQQHVHSLTPDVPLTPNIHHVAVVFSEHTPSESKKTILSYLYYKLGSVPGIRVVYYDIAWRKGPSTWMEEEVGKASAVLVVCNKELTQEWKGEGASVVHALHALVRGHLNDGRDPDKKFAVVLLFEKDRQYIPQGYLRNCVQFLIDDVQNIARYIQQVPEHLPIHHP